MRDRFPFQCDLLRVGGKPSEQKAGRNVLCTQKQMFSLFLMGHGRGRCKNYRHLRQECGGARAGGGRQLQRDGQRWRECSGQRSPTAGGGGSRRVVSLPLALDCWQGLQHLGYPQLVHKLWIARSSPRAVERSWDRPVDSTRILWQRQVRLSVPTQWAIPAAIHLWRSGPIPLRTGRW